MSITQKLFKDGLAAYGSGDFRKAEEAFNQVLATEPYSSETMLNLGNVYYQTNQLDKAQKIWLKAVEINPMEEKAYLNLGNVYFQCQKYQKAIYYWEIFKKLNPTHGSINLNLGCAYEALGKMLKATKFYQMHLHLSKGEEADNLRQKLAKAKVVAAHNIRCAEELMRLGRLEEARDAFASSVGVTPLHPKAYKCYAAVLYQLGELSEAAEWYERAFEEMGHDASITANLGVIYEKMNDPMLALWAYMECMKANPKKIPRGVLQRYNTLWESRGAEIMKEALKQCRDLVAQREFEVAEWRVKRLWDLATVLDNTMISEVRKLFHSLTERKEPRRQCAKVSAALGDDLKAKGQYERAMHFYRRYLEYLPDGELAKEIREKLQELESRIAGVVNMMLSEPPTEDAAAIPEKKTA